MRRNRCAVTGVSQVVRYRAATILLVAAAAASGCVVSPPVASSTPAPAATPNPVAAPTSRVISGAEFTQFGGCGDAYFWATTADDTMAITVEWAGAASEASNNDGFEETANLPQAPLRVLSVVGQRLSETYCTDILTEGPRVDGEAPAVSGSVELRVRPDAGGFKPASHADVTLRDIGFEITFGTEVENWVLDVLELRDISVGWLSG